MASSIVVKVVYLAVMCFVFSVPVLTYATPKCGDVRRELTPCNSYIKGGVQSPPQPCCNALKNLFSEATTKEDRQAICGCFKTALQILPRSFVVNIENLPKKCEVKLPYELSPTIDCTKIQ